MRIPYELEQFVRGIYPEDPRESESLQSLAAAALRDWDYNDLRPVLAWLNELLDGGHSDAELHYVEVVIRPDRGSTRGWRVQTAYPVR